MKAKVEQIEQVEYRTVDEKDQENQINAITDRFNMIKDLMFKDGGYPQALMYLNALFQNHFRLSDVLAEIGSIYDDTKNDFENNSIISKNRFVWGKPGQPYGCLDKDLKFCVRIYKEGDWSDILYVFPYMNATKAYDVSFKYDV